MAELWVQVIERWCYSGALEHGGGMAAMLLRCCSALERRVGERENESESERLGEWRAEGSPFWRGRAGQRQRTAVTRRERPGHGRPRQHTI